MPLVLSERPAALVTTGGAEAAFVLTGAGTRA
jgi:hypothetical protein